MATSENYNDFYQSGGSLPPDFPSYAKREADDLLYNYLKQDQFCYVLTARQMGKSSLRVRIMKRLLSEGYRCCSIDITKIGTTNFTSEEWYFTILDIISTDLKIDFDIQTWWEKEKVLTPVYRFFKFLRTVVLSSVPEKIVFFFDEIDSMLSLNKNLINTDDFFALVRALYNERADNAEFRRLNFVVLGVASPNELMNDVARTPFNIGQSIPLNNLTRGEAELLKAGLNTQQYESNDLLDEILFWTNGQPFLTQKLCEAISLEDRPAENLKAFVRKKADDLFFSTSIAHSNNVNLFNIQNRILENDRYGIQMLQAYSNILKNESVKEETADLSQIYLRLTGLVRREGGKLFVNNNIYKTKLNQSWVADLYNQLNRPFNAALNEWLANAKAGEKAVRGEELKKFNEWGNNRNDLTVQEKEFLQYSNNIEAREDARKEMLAKQEEIEKAAKEKLDAEKERFLAETIKFKSETVRLESEAMRFELERKKDEARKRLYLILWPTFILTIAIISFAYYVNIKKTKKIQEENRIAKMQLDSVNQKVILSANNLSALSRRNTGLKNMSDSLNILFSFLSEQYKNEKSKSEDLQHKTELTKRELLNAQQNIERTNAELLKQEELITTYRTNTPYSAFIEKYPWIASFDEDMELPAIKRHLDNITDPGEKDKVVEGFQLASCAIKNTYKNPNLYYYFLDSALKLTNHDSIIGSYMNALTQTTLFYTQKRPVYSSSNAQTHLPIGNDRMLEFDSYFTDTIKIINSKTLATENTILYNSGLSNTTDTTAVADYTRTVDTAAFLVDSVSKRYESPFFSYTEMSTCFNASQNRLHILFPDDTLRTYNYDGGNPIMKSHLNVPAAFSSERKIFYKSEDEIFLVYNSGTDRYSPVVNEYNQKTGLLKRLNTENFFQSIKKQLTDSNIISRKEYPEIDNIIYNFAQKQFLISLKIQNSMRFFFLADESFSKLTDLNKQLPTHYFQTQTEIDPNQPFVLLQSQKSRNVLYMLNYDGSLDQVSTKISSSAFSSLRIYPEKSFMLYPADIASEWVLLNYVTGKKYSIKAGTYSEVYLSGSQIVSFEDYSNAFIWDYESPMQTKEELEKKYIIPFKRKEFEEETICSDPY